MLHLLLGFWILLPVVCELHLQHLFGVQPYAVIYNTAWLNRNNVRFNGKLWSITDWVLFSVLWLLVLSVMITVYSSKLLLRSGNTTAFMKAKYKCMQLNTQA